MGITNSLQEFIVYILKSANNGKHYYGHTSNLTKRLLDHNSGLSTYTSKYMPWNLIYTETFSTRSEAMKREKFFKSRQGYDWLKDKDII